MARRSRRERALAFDVSPPADCRICDRLAAFRDANRAAFPDFRNAPVESFGDPTARLLIVGLAPGLRGANRTGRPFTGDYAGDLLYATLLAFGFAAGVYDRRPDDGLALVDCAIVNAVRCVPPENKPTPAEIAACRPYLAGAIEGAAAPRGDRRARAHRPRQRAARARRASVALSLRARRATHASRSRRSSCSIAIIVRVTTRTRVR